MGTCQPSMEDFRLPSLEETPLWNKGAGFGNLLLLPTYWTFNGGNLLFIKLWERTSKVSTPETKPWLISKSWFAVTMTTVIIFSAMTQNGIHGHFGVYNGMPSWLNEIDREETMVDKWRAWWLATKPLPNETVQGLVDPGLASNIDTNASAT
jgi:hypothetical protein